LTRNQHETFYTNRDSDSAPLKDFLLFISDSPLDVNKMQNYYDFTKEKFDELKHEDPEEPIQFIHLSEPDYSKTKIFKKRHYPIGKYLGFLFLTNYDYGGQNIEIKKMKIKGFVGKDSLNSLGNVDSDLSDFGKLLQTKDFSDATLKVGNDSFKVHKSILSIRSPYFEKLFKENVKSISN
jgi:hypothetical protein